MKNKRQLILSSAILIALVLLTVLPEGTINPKNLFSGKTESHDASIPEPIEEIPFSDEKQVFRSTIVKKKHAAHDYDANTLPEDILNVSYEFVLQSRHTNSVEDLGVTPSGRHLISYGEYGNIKIWDIETGQILKNGLHGHRDAHGYTLLAVDPKEHYFVTGANDGNIMVWSLPSNSLIKTMHLGTRQIRGVAIDASELILVSYFGGDLEVHNLNTDTPLIKIDDRSISKMALSPKGEFLITANGSSFFKRDSRTGRILKRGELKNGGVKNTITAITVSPSGKRFAVGCASGKIYVIDPRTFSVLQTCTVDDAMPFGVCSLLISPDDQKLVSGFQDIFVWNMNTGNLLHTLKNAGYVLSSLALDQKGQTLFSGGNSGTIRVWDMESGTHIKDLCSLPGRPDRMAEPVSNLTIDPQFKFMIAERGEEEISIWDLGSLKMVKNMIIHNRRLRHRLDPKGRFLATNDHAKNEIELWDLATGAPLTPLKNNLLNFHTQWFDIDPVGEHLVSTHFKAGMYITFIWSAETGGIVKRIDEFNNVVIDPKGKYLAGTALNGYTAKIYDFPSGKLRYEFSVSADTNSKITRAVSTGKYSDPYANEKRYFPGEMYKLIPGPNGTYILAVYLSGRIDIINAETGGWITKIAQLKNHFSSNDVEKIEFDPSGGYVTYKDVISHRAYIWDVRTGRLSCRIEGHCNQILINPTAPEAISVSSAGIKFWNLAARRLRRTMEKRLGITNVVVDKDWQYMIANTTKEILVWNFRTGEIKKAADSKGPLYAMTVPEGNKTVTLPVTLRTGPDDTIELIDPLSGDEIDNPGLRYKNRWPTFSVHGRFVVSINEYNQLKIHNTKRNRFVALAHNGPEWIVYTKEGYFDSSKNGGALVTIVKGLDGYGPDQFAVRKNRPDLILKSIGLGDENLIAHFHHQYQKRLRKSGFSEQRLTKEYHVPHVKILDTRQKGQSVDISFKLRAPKSSLKCYNIYINDVPLFGAAGKKISGNAVTLTEAIELTQGDNKIEVTCMNETGIESYRALTRATYDKLVKGDLYYVGFGVSEYKDSSLNLRYADKDAKDLEDLFLQMQGAYRHVHTKTFINEAVTKTCPEEAKHFLKSASKDDTFILFIAGHGLHNSDKEGTYYFLTHATRLKHLEADAIPYSAFETLLTEVAPRNKIFLMDTCESGDVTDALQDTYFAHAGARKIRPRTTRSLIVVGREQRQNNTGMSPRDRNRYIYNDLLRRSGAVVFSSSKGNEFSYESKDVENGFFTEGIISAFTTTPSDNRGGKYLSLMDFRDNVTTYVTRLSDGLQHPTIDRDNIYQKIRLPFVFERLPQVAETDEKSVGTGIIPDRLHWYIGDLIRVYNGSIIDTGILLHVDEKKVSIGDRSEKQHSGFGIPKGSIYYIDIPDASTPIRYGILSRVKKNTGLSLPGLPLHDVVIKGDIEGVNQLLTEGANVNATAFNGMTPLSFAAKTGRLDIVKLLIEKGADINTQNIDGLSPAYYAIQKGHAGVLIYLVEQGADITVINAFGDTLLHSAVSQEHHIAAVLLDNGFIIDTPNAKGYSALHTAAANNRLHIAELLLQRGIDINIKGKIDGLTPLHVAAVNKSYEVTALLLKNGADVNAKTPAGYTPLKYIKMPKHTRIIGGRSTSVAPLLRSYGGTE